MSKAKKEMSENLKSVKKEELQKKLASFREDLRVIKFKAEGAKSRNVKEALTLRKKIARILTVINATSPNGRSVGRE